MAGVRNKSTIKEKLVGPSNFERWFCQLNTELRNRHIFNVASGKKVKDSCKTLAEKVLWVKKDIVSQRLITSSIDKTLMIHIIHCKSSAEMYERLVTLVGRNVVVTDDTMEKFFKLRYFTKTGYVVFFRSLDKFICRFQAYDQCLTEDVAIRKVLISLPPFYEQFLTEWLSGSTDERTYDNLKIKLISGDTHFSPVDDNGQLVGKACWVCGNPYHNGQYCMKNYVNRKSKVHFDNGCIKYGYMRYFSTSDARRKQCLPMFTDRPRCKICRKDNHSARNCYFRPSRQARNDPTSSSDRNENDFHVSVISKQKRRVHSRSVVTL